MSARISPGARHRVMAVMRRVTAFWIRLPRKAKIGAGILGVFILIAIIGPIVAPYNPSFGSSVTGVSLNPPDASHWLGTTQSGQDVLSQLLVGIRMSLELGFIVGGIVTFLAVAFGVSAAFLGGLLDEVLSLISNVFLVIPALPVLIVLLGYLPQRGQWATVLVLSVLGWPWGARVIRAQTLSLRNRDFVAASREVGESTRRIIFYEIVPNEAGLIVSSFVGTVLYAIGASVGLAFLGLTDLSTWSLGTMLYWAENQEAIQLGAWWWFVPPGIVVALIGTGLVLLNTGIDQLSNPRLRDAGGTRKFAGRTWYPADPTPIEHVIVPRPSRLAGALHSFSRASMFEPEPSQRQRSKSSSLPAEGYVP